VKKTKEQLVYTKEYKKSLVKRMLPPENIHPKDLAEETGVSRTSLSTWLKNADEIIEINEYKTKWIEIDLKKEEEPIKIDPIEIKIGKVSIDVKPGFNREFLLELMRLVNEI
jgi:transcriptional regulator with XRE-family HTH domain